MREDKVYVFTFQKCNRAQVHSGIEFDDYDAATEYIERVFAERCWLVLITDKQGRDKIFDYSRKTRSYADFDKCRELAKSSKTGQ